MLKLGVRSRLGVSQVVRSGQSGQVRSGQVKSGQVRCQKRLNLGAEVGGCQVKPKEWINGWMDGWMGGYWMDGWMGGWMGQMTDEKSQ
jgi:hypothetical protein